MDVSNWVAVIGQPHGVRWRLSSSGFGAEGVVEVRVFGQPAIAQKGLDADDACLVQLA